MNELSLYILDLTQNSITAGAHSITITIRYESAFDRLTVIIEDDGCGMSEEFLKQVTSPFTTTRKTRKVGLGIPMVRQMCEMCEGTFDIKSTLGVGTVLTLVFKASHVDLPPMGDLSSTMQALVNGTPEGVEFKLVYINDANEFVFDTVEIRTALDGVPLNSPDVLMWIRDYVKEGIEETAL